MKANTNQNQFQTKTSSVWRRVFASSLLFAASTLPTFGQTKDLLDGNGRFSSQAQIDTWTKVTAPWYNYEIVGNDYMKYTKLEKADIEGFYDDGLYYFLNGGQFSNTTYKPQHITFEVLTTNNAVEVCDIRLTTLKKETPPPDSEVPASSAAAEPAEDDSSTPSNGIKVETRKPETGSPKGPAGYEREPNKDVVFFRLGYYNFMKVNTESMIHKTSNNQLYKVDILIHWEEQNVSVYVGNEPMPLAQPMPQAFFVKRAKTAESANAIGLYSLTPGGVCHIKNLQVCDTYCAGKNSTVLQLTSAMNLVGSAALATSFALAHILF